MPAKKQITKNEILESAFQIVREKGMGALNMRSLAKRCKCSTQPIYLSFGNSKNLKYEVIVYAIDYYFKFTDGLIASGKYPEYKAVGMAYILFAKEESELFKLLLMNDDLPEDCNKMLGFDKSVTIIENNYGLSEDVARRLHAEMWVFVHGVATMYVTDYYNWEWEFVEQMLSDVFLGITAKIKGED